MDCHALLQWIFLTQGLNPPLKCLLHWQTGSSPLAPPAVIVKSILLSTSYKVFQNLATDLLFSSSFSSLFCFWDPKLQLYRIPYAFPMGHNPFFAYATEFPTHYHTVLILYQNCSLVISHDPLSLHLQKPSSSSVLIKFPPTFSYKILLLILYLPHPWFLGIYIIIVSPGICTVSGTEKGFNECFWING